MRGVILNDTDRQFLEFLAGQGVASFAQAEEHFYFKYSAPRCRINKLVRSGYLETRSIGEVFKRGRGKARKGNESCLARSSVATPFPSPAYFPYLLGLNLRPTSKILLLSDDYRRQLNLTNKLMNRALFMHQLMLNEVRVFIESKIDESPILNDPKLQILSDIHADRLQEFTPDLSIEAGDYVVAIEMERTQKAFQAYASRLNFYLDSAYTHIIYYYSSERHLRSFIKYVGPERRVAFAHYLKPNELLSPAWGIVDFHSFVDKVRHIL
ncbi:MAG: hypothetical protein CL677_00265 [Bdellovibrionaceae bacterium]|jgi:hypothetical protein|nr:hypothetical protein [Pseudobdellovibrionaceae bacterium]|tara:strand:+ start:2658 stop:3461 length:804 start_codon:yes stop_codon:yes gene_type:complete